MDRGIKIAILVACLLSLGFGLIWDKIIDGARRTILAESDDTGMGPTRAEVRIGDTSLPAPNKPVTSPAPSNTPSVPSQAEPNAASDAARATPSTTAGAPVGPKGDVPEHVLRWVADGTIAEGKYTVQAGDGLHKICYDKTRFRYLEKEQRDWMAANPQFKDVDDWIKRLRPGMRITIPQ